MEVRMRRHDRAMADEDAKTLLKNGEFGVLSTVSPDGQPYGIPLSYAYDGDVIFFHSALQGRKLDNIVGNNSVSFCVVGKTEILPRKFSTRFESVIVFGRASEAAGGEKDRGLFELARKYSSAFLEEGRQYIERDRHKARVYKIHIESITGKSRK